METLVIYYLLKGSSVVTSKLLGKAMQTADSCFELVALISTAYAQAALATLVYVRTCPKVSPIASVSENTPPTYTSTTLQGKMPHLKISVGCDHFRAIALTDGSVDTWASFAPFIGSAPCFTVIIHVQPYSKTTQTGTSVHN